MEKHIVAITAFISSGERFLVVKMHKSEVAFAGKWAFPGGKAEKGESIMQTLKREVMEEVGIEIEDYKMYLKDYTFTRPDGHKVIGFCFLVKAKSTNVTLSKDFEDFRWITAEELIQMDHGSAII